jgi:succinate dehydrogenase/fumarate reductase-like Fe-S protein
MDRLTPSARARLSALGLCDDRRAAVLACATAMACAEITDEHIELGAAIEAARREEALGSAA